MISDIFIILRHIGEKKKSENFRLFHFHRCIEMCQIKKKKHDSRLSPTTKLVAIKMHDGLRRENLTSCGTGTIGSN